MKKWEYSRGWKALAVILNQVCAVIMVISFAVCTIYIGSNGFGWLSDDDSFENTAYYQNEVEEQIRRCIRAASRESKFEKNGVYDAKLLINVEEYARKGRILSTDTSEGGLYYRLTDLLNWSMDQYEPSTLMKITYDDGTIGYISKSSMNYTEQSLYDDGSAVASTSVVSDNGSVPIVPEEAPPEETDTEESFMEDAELYSGMPGQGAIQNVESIEAIEERYAPVGYPGITAYAEEQKLSAKELQDIFRDLENTLTEIYNDFYSYKENLELFSPSMTNMRYLVIPGSVNQVTVEDYEQKTYTNIRNFGDAEITDKESLLAYIRTHKDYLIFDSSNMNYESHNMPMSLSEVSSYLNGYEPSVQEDYILAIAVDPKYLASDKLQAYKQQYEQIQPVSKMAVYGVILGAFLYLLSLVYLTMAAGRGTDGGDRSIRLNGFDKIRTEAAFLLVGLPAGAAAWLLQPADPQKLGLFVGMSSLRLTIFEGGLTFFLNLMFLVLYLSLVRRLKSRTLWTNSVLCSVPAHLEAMVRNRKLTTKTWISYLGFLIGNFVLLCMGSWGFLAALLLDLLVGVVLMQQAVLRQRILDGIKKISEGDISHQISTEKMGGDSLTFAETVNSIGEGLSAAVDQSVKDERLKSDLITNVSHDIKTPLTSIINYVDLLKREDIQNDRVKNYIAILEDKAQRLKHLADDLVEASKISSGNVKLELVRLNFQELINQTNGEFSEKFEDKDLQLVVNMPKDPVVIEADGRRLWRVLENVYNNVAKYAMPGTRVYVDLTVVGHMVRFNVKNISEQPLNIQASELTERFIRGDVARSTEGSGLGLSIAKNLTQLQKGSFEIYLDGDLFKATIIFPEAPFIERSEETGTEPEEQQEPFELSKEGEYPEPGEEE